MDNISVDEKCDGGKLRVIDRNIQVVEEFISKERVEYCIGPYPAESWLRGD